MNSTKIKTKHDDDGDEEPRQVVDDNPEQSWEHLKADWDERLTAIAEELRELGCVAVFLYIGDDHITHETQMHDICRGNGHAQMGMLIDQLDMMRGLRN